MKTARPQAVSEGRGRISNHEYFAKMVRSISTWLADTTEHGFVFRVDLALRPHGNSGPSAVSLGALGRLFGSARAGMGAFRMAEKPRCGAASAIASAGALRRGCAALCVSQISRLQRI